MQFDNCPLVAEQNSYSTKFVNVYIVYDIDGWPEGAFDNVSLKNSLFGANSIVKNDVKERYVYSGYWIAFDGKGSATFNDDFARDVKIFGVDIIS